jgi:glycosyltransferase involved in cell wall biosynthesis
MKKPYISVIITAYNRKEFLKEAVQSVLNQTLDKNLYEVIVIKNFRTHLDRKWRINGVKLIYKPAGSIGDFLYTGVLHSRGSIISFLDDDDTFAKNKLKIIYDEFSKNPSIIYYHNNCKVIYENKYIKSKNNNIITTNVKKRFFASASNIASIYKFILPSTYFNLSSAAIKKKPVLDNIRYLKKIISNPDDFFAYMAIASIGRISCDNRKLTNYRIHTKNTSISVNLSNYNVGYYNYTKMLPIFEKLLLHNNSIVGIKVLYAKYIRNKMNDSILNSKQIELNDFYHYIKDYSIPLLFYCKRIDLFLPLIILHLLNRNKSKRILAERQGINL